MDDVRVIEAMLLRWGESHSSGRTVTFLLPDDEGPHPFKGVKCGPANGQRVGLSVALIDDDETEKPLEKPKEAKVPKPLAREAALYCKNPVFRKFLGVGDDENEAAYIVREECGVKSRAEIDLNKEASDAWISMRGKFKAWELV